MDECDVKAAQAGNRDAFTRLIKQSEKSMYRIAAAILKSDQSCTDAMQEAIIKAYKSIRTLKNPQHFKTWLIRILINECRNILRVENKIVPLDTIMEQSKNEDEYEKLEVRHAVSSLEEELRILVILYYFEDMTMVEISGLLNIPEGTVKSRLHRARLKLAESLKVQTERSACHE